MTPAIRVADRAAGRQTGGVVDPAPILRLRLTLLDCHVPVWRRLELSADAPLPDVHRVFQAAMGWESAHLHQFFAGPTTDAPAFGEAAPGWPDGPRDEAGVPLSELAAAKGDRFLYEYDFGDSWLHRATVLEVLPPPDGATRPRCVGGRGACPPEDVGGVWGYAELLTALADERHPDHAFQWEQFGEPIDPRAFDPAAADARLARLVR